MSRSIEVIPTCASNQADFEITSSDGTKVYTVTTYGPEMEMGCTCAAGQNGRRNCKHRDYIAKYACVEHPQADVHGSGTIRPNVYHHTGHELEDKCKVCGGPTYAVKYLI